MGGFWQNRVKKETMELRSKHFLNFLKSIKTWQLILILIPMLFMSATFLRFDHLKMNELKEAVFEADRAGENDDGEIPAGVTQKSQAEITAEIAEKVRELKKFSESHIVVNFIEKNGKTEMVFGTGPFYLDHQYNRLARAAIQNAQVLAAQYADNNPNGNVYAKANDVCRPQAIANRWNWNSAPFIACMTTEIQKYPTTDYITSQISANIPNTALFRYDFASPVWAPTISGLLILLSAIVLGVIIMRLFVVILLNIAMIFLK